MAEPLQETDGFDPNELTGPEQYKLLGAAVVPRPIGLVTTVGPNGPNAAPFSYFMALSQDPPMLMFSIGKTELGEFSAGVEPGLEKDTLRNLRDVPEFVVHIVSDDLADKMNICAVQYPSEINEIELAGFRTAKSFRVRPPRLLNCPVQLECKVHQVLVLGRVPYHVVIGEVVYMHFTKGLVNEKLRVDWQKLNPIARLARPGVYLRITDHFSIAAPSREPKP